MEKIFLIILAISFGVNSFGQTDSEKEEAREIAFKAIKLMDNGEIDASIKMLKESKGLDPKNYSYPYEIGYAYFLKNDYKNSIKTLKEVVKYKENSDECFTLLGNVYDYNKQPKKAIDTYEEGLKKFPKSGRLFFEIGNVKVGLKEYDEALSSWEKGIKVSPSYPSNYHIASKYYSSYTTEKIWGVLYGELFMNLERSSKKTEETSKLLYDTYKSSITIKSKTEAGVSFSKSMTMTLPKDGEEMKIPFEMPYGTMMILSVTPEMLAPHEVDISSLHRIRKSFITTWYETGKNEKYPNILFDWQQKLIELGYFESYNYWLFMKGNEEEFNKWVGENQETFNKFIEWFKANPLTINAEHKFHRLQY